MNSDNDMPEVEEDVVVGGGPAEGDEALAPPNPNPDAVHPDFLQTMPGAPAPATDVESGSDEA
jgi:hypothetical protein